MPHADLRLCFNPKNPAFTKVVKQLCDFELDTRTGPLNFTTVDLVIALIHNSLALEEGLCKTVT